MNRTPRLTTRIQQYLRANPGAGVLEISADLDANPTHIARILHKLKSKGKAQRYTTKPKCYDHPR